MKVEANLKDSTSLFYMGPAYEHLLDFETDNPTEERLNRLLSERNHFYSYLYTACILKQTMWQWKRSGYDISGTVTEIYDFLRLLYARVSTAYSYHTGEPMVRYTETQIVNLIMERYSGKKIHLLSPLVRGRKGHYREIFQQILKWGFLYARIDGIVQEVLVRMQVDRYKTHNIEMVVDTLEVREENRQRLVKSVQTAMKFGKGTMMVLDVTKVEPKLFSRFLMCPTTGISYPEPEANTFSFNSPYGACPHCHGLGEVVAVDFNKLVPNPEKSIREGGLAPLGKYKSNWMLDLHRGGLPCFVPEPHQPW